MVRTVFVSVIVLMAAVAALGSEELPSRADGRDLQAVNPLEKIFPVVAKVMQGLAAAPSDPNFPCNVCKELTQMLYNMTVDKTFLAFIENFMETYACDYWAPAGFKEYCLDYVRDLPNLIKDFADTFLDPTTDCAMVCNGPPADRHPNTVLNVLAMKKSKKAGGF